MIMFSVTMYENEYIDALLWMNDILIFSVLVYLFQANYSPHIFFPGFQNVHRNQLFSLFQLVGIASPLRKPFSQW